METYQIIKDLEYQRADAWLKHDREALSALLHKNYIEVNIFGRFTKQQVLDELFPNHVLLEYQMSDIEWLNLGKSAGGLSYHVTEKLESGEKVESYICHVVSLYKKEENSWRLLLWQITPLLA